MAERWDTGESHPGHGDHGHLPLTRTTQDQLSTGFLGRYAPLWQSFRNWIGRLPARDRLSIAVYWRGGRFRIYFCI